MSTRAMVHDEIMANNANNASQSATNQSTTNNAETDAATLSLTVAPSQAMATLYQTSSASVGLSHQNAVHAQNLQYSINNSVVLEALSVLHGSRQRAADSDKLDSALDRIIRLLDALDSSKAARPV